MSGKPGADIIRTCILCGEQFHPNSTRQKCCNKEISVPCIICGKPIKQICTTKAQPKTCSRDCTIALGNAGREASAHKLAKTCKYCGKSFIPKSSRDEYCSGPHYSTCEVCGKQFEVTGRYNHINKTCSDKCSYVLAKRNTNMSAMQEHLKSAMLEKYGVENPGQIPGVWDKIKESNLRQYGKEYYTQTDRYKEQVKQTSIAKYGVDHHAKSDVVKEKRKDTIQRKYGVDNVFQDASVKAKIRQTNLARYDVEIVSQSPKIIKQVKDSNLAKYGVEHPMMLPEYKDKAKQTNIKRYGYVAITQAHIKNIENWYRFIDNPRQYITEHYSATPRTDDLAKDLGVDRSTVDDYLNKHNATDAVRRARSLMEESLVAYIHQLRPDCKVITNTHKILAGKELDIYLPEYKFAIECNPTVTHNSTAGDPWGGAKKSINYHKYKTDMCQERGIFLMHIFGYEWSHNRDIILSMVANILGCCTKIYARKCTIHIVEPAEAKEFLSQNHRQGYATTKVHLGLYFDNELVSIMSFGKMRSTIGTDASDLSNCWELVRFCNKLNTTVVGGASKLFKYFISEYSPTQVRSFSDRSHTRGLLYETLGFKVVRQSNANYVWVNIVDDKSYHRINAQKRNLKRFLNDDTLDLSQSEKQIMESHGFVQVYDSGTITWEWRNP